MEAHRATRTCPAGFCRNPPAGFCITVDNENEEEDDKERGSVCAADRDLDEANLDEKICQTRGRCRGGRSAPPMAMGKERMLREHAMNMWMNGIPLAASATAHRTLPGRPKAGHSMATKKDTWAVRASVFLTYAWLRRPGIRVVPCTTSKILRTRSIVPRTERAGTPSVGQTAAGVEAPHGDDLDLATVVPNRGKTVLKTAYHGTVKCGISPSCQSSTC